MSSKQTRRQRTPGQRSQREHEAAGHQWRDAVATLADAEQDVTRPGEEHSQTEQEDKLCHERAVPTRVREVQRQPQVRLQKRQDHGDAREQREGHQQRWPLRRFQCRIQGGAGEQQPIPTVAGQRELEQAHRGRHEVNAGERWQRGGPPTPLGAVSTGVHTRGRDWLGRDVDRETGCARPVAPGHRARPRCRPLVRRDPGARRSRRPRLPTRPRQASARRNESRMD